MDKEEYVSSEADSAIIADADYIDKVAFDLTVNFERMIGRRIPRADMARWAECVALDGGLRGGDGVTQVVLIHDHQTTQLRNFTPSDIEGELDGKAFGGNLGEFRFAAVPTEAMADKTRLCLDMAAHFCYEHKARRIMIVADMDEMADELRRLLRDAPDDKRVTLFAMEPLPAGNYRTEILGYSLMSALGIKSEELRIEN